jgi:mono/diheme cytochrome c family protein
LRKGIAGAVLAAACLSMAAANAEPPSVARSASEYADEATWSIDPALPGADLPPVGRSAFDFLLARRMGANAPATVPFPFSTLLRQVSDTLAHDAREPSPIRAVLIPLGRSLQRTAAAHHYFESPRIVVAIDGEPRETGAGLVLTLRDRLYLGYQPRADVIEVISYNEAAGRFEFQVVSNYRAGGSAKVTYARRAVCMACHQNGGPIFSRGVWSETNANPRVAAALLSVRDRFEGIEVDRGIDIPAAIDASVRRANKLAAYQWLWRNGCAALGSGAPEVRCRAQAAIAALQYRLSGRQAYDETAPAFRDRVVGAMGALKKTEHGPGLALPDPGLPNRDPLQAHGSSLRPDHDYNSAVDVTAPYDPLSARQSLETWAWEEPDLLARRLVTGLSDFFTDSDSRRLDATLFRAAMAGKASRQHSTFDCDVGTTQLARARRRVTFACAASGVPLQSPARLEGSLVVDGLRVESGSVDRMTFAEPNAGAGALRNIAIVEGSIAAARARAVATFRIARDGVHVRRGDGNAVESVRLYWTDSAANGPVKREMPNGANGGAVVTTVEDFAPIFAAVDTLQRDTLNGNSDVLSALPFRRAAILSALERRPGSALGRWCCIDDSQIAVPAVVETVPVALESAAALSDFELAFHRHCALCHRSNDPAPPNFLMGTPQQVQANLAHCAQRLYVRLAMWDQAPETRAKTPMPPFSAMRGARISESEWRASSDLAALRRYVAKILQQDPGKFQSPEAVLHTNYEQLRTCLP